MLSETRPAKVGKWTEPALRVLRERYLTRQGGEVVETPEEMCWRVALTIAHWRRTYQSPNWHCRKVVDDANNPSRPAVILLSVGEIRGRSSTSPNRAAACPLAARRSTHRRGS